MKRLSETEFLALAWKFKNCDWTVQEGSVDEYQASEDEYRKTYRRECYGYCIIASGEYEIEYSICASSGNKSNYKESFEFEECGINLESDRPWELNFEVDVDSESDFEIRDHLIRLFGHLYCKEEIRAHLMSAPDDEVIEEMGESESVLEQCVVARDNGPDFLFSGGLLASMSSSANNSHSNYSGSTGRSKEYNIWLTRGGKYVAQKIDRSQWQGERDRYAAEVFETAKEVGSFFGYGWLAKLLYEEAGLSITTEVD